MKAVIQRVSSAFVSVDGIVSGKINKGLIVFCGVEDNDDEKKVEKCASKICALRIFPNDKGKMFYSVEDIGGEILVVSNFTLCASLKSGNRPDFTSAAKADKANTLYEYFKECVSKRVKTASGVFGADMTVSVENDGPVTITLDSDNI